jgi:heme exporter protein C
MSIIRKNWWKWLGIALLMYALFGGLLMPLKTGITGVSPLSIKTGEASWVKADIYNPGSDFKPETAILGGRYGVTATEMKFDADGVLNLNFNPHLGKDKTGGVVDLFVKANGQWMAFPAAVSLVKGIADTGASNFTKIAVTADPDKLKGFPNRPILNESIRNLLYHVPMWFSMIWVLLLSAVYSVKYLSKNNLEYDLRSDALIRTGILAGLLGCATGSVWASVTWGSWWPRDPKLNGVAIGMIMYLAYLLLRKSVQDDYQRARISAVYNLFIFPIFIALIAIMPKLGGESLHPGAAGTVGFNEYDLDNTLRMFFYPSVAAWCIIFTWAGSLLYRINKIDYKIETE